MSKNSKKRLMNNYPLSWFNLPKVRKLNLAYIKIKKIYRDAVKENKTELWEKARIEYEKYYDEIYNRDIDQLIELSTICQALEDYDSAIKYIEEAQEYQKGNPAFAIRLGFNYGQQGEWVSALKNYKKLLSEGGYEQEMNSRLLLNCATCCIKIAGGHEPFRKEEKEQAKKDLVEISARLDVLPETADSIEADSVRTSLDRILKDTPPLKDHKIKHLTKATAGKKSRLTSDLRLGVMIYLHLYESATPYQIRDKWLKSAKMTSDIIKQLVDGEYIKKLTTLSDGTPVYVNLQLGNSYAHQYLNSIVQIYHDPEKNDVEFGVVFSQELIDSAMDWLTEYDGYQVPIPEQDDEGNIVEIIYFYRNKEELKGNLRNLEKKLKELEKRVGKKESEDLRNRINAIDAGTYMNKL